MMDLFRHRSQSAVSAEDKRKAVSLIHLIYFTFYFPNMYQILLISLFIY